MSRTTLLLSFEDEKSLQLWFLELELAHLIPDPHGIEIEEVEGRPRRDFIIGAGKMHTVVDKDHAPIILSMTHHGSPIKQSRYTCNCGTTTGLHTADCNAVEGEA